MKILFSKNNPIYCILFSFLFLPLRINLGNILSDSKTLILNSNILVDGFLENSSGININFPLSDIATLFLIIKCFQQKEKIEKHNFVIFFIIYLLLIFGSLNLSLTTDNIILINAYNTRFIFYTFIFIFNENIFEIFLPYLKRNFTFICPLIFLIYSIVNNTIEYNLPNLYGSRLEIFPPLMLFAFITIYYHRIENIKLNSTKILFILLNIINYLICGKRGLLIPIAILIIFFIINEIKKGHINFWINFNNYKLIFLPLLLILTIISVRTIKLSPTYSATIYSKYITNSSIKQISYYLDYSSQERLGKMYKTINIFKEYPGNILKANGLNSFKIYYGYLPDSILESFFSFGLIQTLYLIYFSCNLNKLKNWIKAKSKKKEFILFYIPIIFIIGLGFTCNVLGIIYIYPPIAIFNSLINKRLIQR